jgi:O-antigen/teichoic acid export membrane protein
MLHYGIRYYFGKVSNLVNFQMGTLILAAVAPEVEIGLFSLALAMVVRIELIPAALSTVLLSRVAVDPAGRADLVAQCVRVTLAVVGAVLALGSLAAYPFFALLLPKFMPAVVVIWLLVPGEWIRSAAKLFVPYFAGTNRPGIASMAVMIGLVANVAVLLVLMPIWGIKGVAVSVTVSYFVSSAILAVAFRRTSGLGYWQTWCPRRTDLNMAAEAARMLWRRLFGGRRQQP